MTTILPKEKRWPWDVCLDKRLFSLKVNIQIKERFYNYVLRTSKHGSLLEYKYGSYFTIVKKHLT